MSFNKANGPKCEKHYILRLLPSSKRKKSPDTKVVPYVSSPSPQEYKLSPCISPLKNAYERV